MTRRNRGAFGVFKLVLLALLLAWTLVPILWMVLSSFKPDTIIAAARPRLFFKPTLENYAGLFSGPNNLWHYVFNSLLIVGVSTVIAVVLGATAGFGLSHLRMKGKNHLAFWIISTRMAPIAAVIVPLYLIFRYLHLLDTYYGLIIAYLSFNLPFAIWLMTAFFDDLPYDLYEAARVDGVSEFKIYLYVLLPLTRPGLVTTTILCFIFAWNDYGFAQTFSGPGTQTIPIAATQLLTQTGIDWGKLLAIGTIVVSPMAFFGLLVKRWLVQGLTLGSVK